MADFPVLESLSCSLISMSGALMLRYAVSGDPAVISSRSLALWLLSLLASNASGIVGLITGSQTVTSTPATAFATVYVGGMVSVSLCVAVYRRRRVVNLDNVSLDWLLFAPFIFALTHGPPHYSIASQALMLTEAFGHYLSVGFWIPQLVLLHRSPAQDAHLALLFSIYLFWLSKFVASLSRFMNLYGDASNTLSPALLADLATALLLAEPLLGDPSMFEAIAERLDRGVYLRSPVAEKLPAYAEISV